tara:strand:- start:1183 stop:1608 length:426 start_codon:yes stop_codon:yes gene_type:complete
MQTQFRPYNMCQVIVDADSTAIVLRDTAGTPLRCNYISIATSAVVSQPYSISIEPQEGLTTPVGHQASMAASLGLVTSGWVGTVGQTNAGEVATELLLSDVDRVDTINYQQTGTDHTQLFITYGQIQSGNVGRDNLRPTGD